MVGGGVVWGVCTGEKIVFGIGPAPWSAACRPLGGFASSERV